MKCDQGPTPGKQFNLLSFSGSAATDGRRGFSAPSDSCARRNHWTPRADFNLNLERIYRKVSQISMAQLSADQAAARTVTRQLENQRPGERPTV